MADITTITEFEALTLPQKIDFFEISFNNTTSLLEEKQLNQLLKSIILNSAENTHVRKMAVEAFTDCVFLDKLKVRYELTILLDEWNENEEVFLEIRRLKDLFLFFYTEPDSIEKIYQQQTSNAELEIVAESYYHLGLIMMQSALRSDTLESCITILRNSSSYFKQSSNTIENRPDAIFFETVVSLLIDLLEEKVGDVSRKLKLLSNVLFRQEVLSFSERKHSFHISFYRTLLNLNKLKEESISNWLDFRKGLGDLFYYYSEMKNIEVENRLNQRIGHTVFTDFTEKQFVQPYFAKNFTAELSRIESRLNEADLSAEQRDFLLYIKELATNADLKKKVDDSIRSKIINSFPHRQIRQIDDAISRVGDLTNPHNLMQVYEVLSKPSTDRFLDALVWSCIELQGNNIFDNATEDQRNSSIASLLDGQGNTTKDQTKWSVSYAGKSSGEIDIYVLENDGTRFAIIEALELDSLKRGYIKLHIDKVFKYDTSGLKQNFILIYAKAKNFVALWKKYVEFIKAHSYEYRLIKFEEIEQYKYADLRLGKAYHERNGKEVFLYHLMLNLHHDL